MTVPDFGYKRAIVNEAIKKMGSCRKAGMTASKFTIDPSRRAPKKIRILIGAVQDFFFSLFR